MIMLYVTRAKRLGFSTYTGGWVGELLLIRNLGNTTFG
jgi:hypothetical protein